ncbi:MAG: SPOR domain-containing protein [Nitrospirae bacterium]|nr:SPOR domain-containing protein [Nitrospirota bacterium]
MREIRKLRSREGAGRKKRRWRLMTIVLLLSVLGVWAGLTLSKKLSSEPATTLTPGMIYLTEKKPPPVPAVETKELSQEKPAPEENEKEDRFTFYKTLPTKKDQIVPLTPEKKEKGPTPIVIPPLPAENGAETGAGKSQTNKTVNASTGFTIQVAALKDRQNAYELVTALRGKGQEVYVVPFSSAERGTLYRVRVGHYQSRIDAQKAADKLSREGLNTFVLKED